MLRRQWPWVLLSICTYLHRSSYFLFCISVCPIVHGQCLFLHLLSQFLLVEVQGFVLHFVACLTNLISVECNLRCDLNHQFPWSVVD